MKLSDSVVSCVVTWTIVQTNHDARGGANRRGVWRWCGGAAVSGEARLAANRLFALIGNSGLLPRYIVQILT